MKKKKTTTTNWRDSLDQFFQGLTGFLTQGSKSDRGLAGQLTDNIPDITKKPESKLIHGQKFTGQLPEIPRQEFNETSSIRRFNKRFTILVIINSRFLSINFYLETY